MAKLKAYDAAGKGLRMKLDSGVIGPEPDIEIISETYLGQGYYLGRFKLSGSKDVDGFNAVVYEGEYDYFLTNFELLKDGVGIAKFSDIFISASELVTGGPNAIFFGDDRILGNSYADRILGFGGDDILYGNRGNDVLYGMFGNDRLLGGGGKDLLKGQAGNDLIKGGAGNDRLLGGGGMDKLKGGKESDLLKGQAGSDRLNGGGGDDTLDGGAGKDLINGGRGDDALYGGRSPDVFVFGKKDGQDQIYDFNEVEDYLFFRGADSLTDLDLSDVRGDAVARFGQTTVVIEGVSVNDLIEGDAFFF